MNRIEQRTSHDCVVCSLAMFLDRAYEEIAGRGKLLAATSDWNWTPEEPVSFGLMWAIADSYGKPVVSGRNFLMNRPALLSVVSTNPAWHHVVFWTGERVIDPHRNQFVDEEYVRTKLVDVTHAIADMAPLILELTPTAAAPIVTKGSE